MSGSATSAGPGSLRLVALHTRLQVLETARTPIAVVSTALFPVLAFLFFVAPQDFADDPTDATVATAQLAVFSVASVCLFSFGAGVAEDRALPWDAYLRTLPAGPLPRFAGRLLTGLLLCALGIAPLVLAALTLTGATLPVLRWPLSAAALAGAAIPLLGMGLAVGYAMPAKAAVAVAQLLLFPLSFAGALFLPPELFPGWLDAVSQALPTRAGRDLVVAATTEAALPAAAPPVLLLWSAAMTALAVVMYRRDEGRRFR